MEPEVTELIQSLLTGAYLVGVILFQARKLYKFIILKLKTKADIDE
tara:strand:- start:3272 stop:3409 length:138 start_codon:yes stop_codon:yes gene_type:complete